MARGIFHRSIEVRRGRLCYQVFASPRMQIVRRFILDHAVAIGAAIEIDSNYSRPPAAASSKETRP